MEIILLFFCLQLVNVILSTIKTCITIKGNKIASTVATSLYYGFYTVIIVFTTADFDLWVKVVITIVTNLVGVYFSMWLLDKLSKDRLWEITATVKTNESKLKICEQIKDLPYNVIVTELGYFVFHIYAQTKKDSLVVKEVVKNVGAKYFVHEQTVKL